MTDQTLREFVAQHIARSREADPHIIARRLITKLNDEHRDHLVLVGLERIVMEEVRFGRSETTTAAENPHHHGTSRWKIATRIHTDEWKLLDDCGVDDLLALAARYERRAELNMAKAVEIRGLAERLRRSGCATVGELRELELRSAA